MKLPLLHLSSCKILLLKSYADLQCYLSRNAIVKIAMVCYGTIREKSYTQTNKSIQMFGRFLIEVPHRQI